MVEFSGAETIAIALPQQRPSLPTGLSNSGGYFEMISESDLPELNVTRNCVISLAFLNTSKATQNSSPLCIPVSARAFDRPALPASGCWVSSRILMIVRIVRGERQPINIMAAISGIALLSTSLCHVVGPR
jgi:hypothetical protein